MHNYYLISLGVQMLETCLWSLGTYVHPFSILQSWTFLVLRNIFLDVHIIKLFSRIISQEN